MKPPRDVYIELNGGMYLVYYAQRRKGQRYLAASVYAHSLERAERWVRDNPKLNLVAKATAPE